MSNAAMSGFTPVDNIPCQILITFTMECMRSKQPMTSLLLSRLTASLRFWAMREAKIRKIDPEIK
ncbi:hypothetical protein I3760_13G136100 [Carya illinoinensis]|nr:hypothetical protein I3760_13G136100 [Carya illinoinensis]